MRCCARVWIQQFHRDVDSATGRQEVRPREQEPDGGDGIPPGHLMISSPYDTDARYSIKRDYGWEAYKVHFTETCRPVHTHNPGDDSGPGDSTDDGQSDPPGELRNLITIVEITSRRFPTWR